MPIVAFMHATQCQNFDFNLRRDRSETSPLRMLSNALYCIKRLGCFLMGLDSIDNSYRKMSNK